MRWLRFCFNHYKESTRVFQRFVQRRYRVYRHVQIQEVRGQQRIERHRLAVNAAGNLQNGRISLRAPEFHQGLNSSSSSSSSFDVQTFGW